MEGSPDGVEDLGETLESTQPMDQDTPFEFGARATSAQQVYDEILTYMLSIVPAQRGLILLARSGAAEPARVAAMEAGAPSDPAVCGIDQGHVRRAMESKDAVYTPSRIGRGAYNPRHAIQLGETRCSIVAPLLAAGGEALGVICLDSWDVFHQLDRRQVPWITAAAEPAARAIERLTNQHGETP